MKVFLRIRVLATSFLQRKSSLLRGLTFLASDAAAIRELFKRTNGLAKFDNRAPCETRLLQETQGCILHKLPLWSAIRESRASCFDAASARSMKFSR